MLKMRNNKYHVNYFLIKNLSSFVLILLFNFLLYKYAHQYLNDGCFYIRGHSGVYLCEPLAKWALMLFTFIILIPNLYFINSLLNFIKRKLL